ncbi:unnamed protein product [Prorocentrum cordatum]|uniref:Uncharacterized protein n=1 Tax=Prorocentrum cordatum TaxID=2364126 RepID=A0ABN9QU83_9DINO|nr:unnamed protein product [Polarella glacialis]
MGTWPLRCWFKLPQLVATGKSLATPPSASIEMGCCMASYRSQGAMSPIGALGASLRSGQRRGAVPSISARPAPREVLSVRQRASRLQPTVHRSSCVGRAPGAVSPIARRSQE